MGFPPGAAFKLLSQVYKKYETLANMRLEKARQGSKTRDEPKRVDKVVDLEKESPVVREEVVTSEGASMSRNSATVKNNVSHKSPSSEVKTGHQTETTGKESKKNTKENGKPKSDSGSNEAESTKAKITQNEDRSRSDEEDEVDPELARQQKEFQSHAESYNGAMRDNYSWSQSITDVDVVVTVPEYIRKGRDVNVEISKKSLCVRHKSCEAGAEWQVLVEGPLTWEVTKEESMWSLEAGKSINISLEKKQERWWEALIEGEPKISVRKIDASRPMTDLDGEAQAKIEEMMYNEQQKKLGLPQSHEKKTHDMLKNAWDAEGSPFKGQPFDPSSVNFSNDMSGMLGGNPPPP